MVHWQSVDLSEAMQGLASNCGLGPVLIFASLTLLGPAGLLQRVLLLVMQGVPKGKYNHTSTFQASACATPVASPLLKGHVAKTNVKGCRSALLSSHSHGQRVSRLDVIVLQGNEEIEQSFTDHKALVLSQRK